MAKTVEVEISGPCNENLVFRPANRVLRGEFLWTRCRNPLAMQQAQSWGDIPGQKIVLDTERCRAAIVEPIVSDPKHARLRQRIEKGELRLPEAEEVFELDQDGMATWCFWIKRAVEAGLAVVRSGAIPEKLPGRPRLDFGGPRPVDPRDQTIAKLTELVLGLLPAERRREVAAALTE